MSYLRIAIRGISWLSLLQISIRSLSLIKFFFIVRILSSYQIGIFAIVTIVLGFFEVVTELGISSFLIHVKGTGKEYLSAAWLISIIRGIVLFILMILFAYPAILFFNQKGIFVLLLVASFVLLFKGVVNPAVAQFSKKFNFHKEFVYRSSISITETISAICLVYLMRTPMALVISLLLSTIVEFVLSFFLVSDRPRLTYEKNKILEILHFSKWITITGVLTYLSQELDSIVVGRSLGISDLGIYQIVQKFSLQLLSEGGDILAKVMFPIYSAIKSSKERLRYVYGKTLFVIGGIAFLGGTILFLAAKQFVSIFLGKEYVLVALIPFRIFLILGVLTVIMSIITALFLSQAKQVFTGRIIILRFVLLAVLIYPLSSHYGIIGASLASLLSFVFVYPLAIFYNKLIFK